MKDYLQINREAWNAKAEVHFDSAFYDVEGFVKGKNSLNEIELNLLGNLQGKSVLHLQCHFGQDTISLSRLGAKATGVDFSDSAIEKARELARQLGTDTQFVCCPVYDLPQYLDETFDFVFTSYGTIGWLPDMEKWAAIIARFLKPGGQFVFVEFHPVVWMFDDDFSGIAYSYFNTGQITETESGTYADRKSGITHEYIMWNHGIAEVLKSLLNHKLEILAFDEWNYSPYNCFRHTVEVEPGKFRIAHLDNKIPMLYSLKAVKK